MEDSASDVRLLASAHVRGWCWIFSASHGANSFPCQQTWMSNPLFQALLVDRTGGCGERSVWIRPDQPNGTHDKYQDYSEDNRILSNILARFVW